MRVFKISRIGLIPTMIKKKISISR
uniref:Uncharacterized protein n=1 Tax=Lepeophtheirus salmonis TaxID=72036 RepID=A0A0K2UDE6_LEPSM